MVMWFFAFRHSASPFFASSAAFASAAAFLFSALTSSLVAAFNSAFLAFSCVFRSSRFAVSVATSDSIFSFSAVFSATTAA